MTDHATYLDAIQQARTAYLAVLDRPVDDHGLAESLRLIIDRGYTYDDLVAWLERSEEYREIQPPPLPPPAATPPLPPIQGQLGVDGMAFRDDTGRRVPLFCHAGDLIMLFVEGRERQDRALEQRVHHAFTDLRDHGYSDLRSWWSIRWRGQPHH